MERNFWLQNRFEKILGQSIYILPLSIIIPWNIVHWQYTKCWWPLTLILTLITSRLTNWKALLILVFKISKSASKGFVTSTRALKRKLESHYILAHIHGVGSFPRHNLHLALVMTVTAPFSIPGNKYWKNTSIPSIYIHSFPAAE